MHFWLATTGNKNSCISPPKQKTSNDIITGNGMILGLSESSFLVVVLCKFYSEDYSV